MQHVKSPEVSTWMSQKYGKFTKMGLPATPGKLETPGDGIDEYHGNVGGTSQGLHEMNAGTAIL